MRWTALLAMLCWISAAAAGCTRAVRQDQGRPAIIRIAGSDTMQPLVRMWAESFMRLHPGVSVYTEGGGSGRGFVSLIEGDVDLAAGSRAMQADEIKRLLDNRGFLGQSILTAKDALSIYLHPANPVRDLSLGQLRGILEGEIRNWQEVGGRDAPIDLIGRQPSSGTYSFLQQHLLEGRPYGRIAQTAPHTRSVIELVTANENALGYGGVAYGPDLIHCRIDGVEPTLETVRDGSYPLARYLYLFAAGPLEGNIRDFVNWVLSDEAQRIVREVGYIPLWEVGPAK